MATESADRRYRSRKFWLAASSLAIATSVLYWVLAHVLGDHELAPHLIPLLMWWSGTVATVLGIYKVATIADEKLNGGGK